MVTLWLAATAGAVERPASGPGTIEGARALLREFLKPGADHARLTARLRPARADYAGIYRPEAAAKLEAAYEPAWEGGAMVIRGKPGQTELLVWKTSAEELKAWAPEVRRHLPGGYQRVGKHLRPGVTLFSFKFVEPGQTLGMAFDGLVYVNGHWRIIPKPWRVLE